MASRKHNTAALDQAAEIPAVTLADTRTRWVAALLITVLSVSLLWTMRDYGLLGFDTYPVIVTSKVQSFGDFISNFSSKLMKGRYYSDFYRPLLNLSVAWDYAWWGLNPLGYHITSTVLLAACAAALFGMVRRLAGPRAWLAPLVALVMFMTHAALYTVVPVPPRRPELLCGTFMLLALYLQLSPRALASKWPPVWPALMTVLAIGSKETAIVLPVCLAIAVWLYSPRVGFKQRTLHTIVALIPHATAVGIMIAVRFAVVGGVGGHRKVTLAMAIDRAPLLMKEMLTQLVFPQRIMASSTAAIWLTALAGGGLLLTLIAGAVWRGRGGAPATDSPARCPATWKGLVLTAVWVGLTTMICLPTGNVLSWYALIPLAAWSCVIGLLIAAVARLCRGKPLFVTALASVTLLLNAGLISWQASYWPVLRGYDDWRRATAAGDAFLEDLQGRLEQLDSAGVINAPPIPQEVPLKPDGSGFRGVLVLREYSVQAWAELTFPDLFIRAWSPTRQQPRPRPPEPGETLILITQRQPGF